MRLSVETDACDEKRLVTRIVRSESLKRRRRCSLSLASTAGSNVRPAIVGERIEIDLGVGIEREQEVPAAVGVLLERRDLAGQERARRAEHHDDGRVLGDLVAEALGEPEVLDRVVLRLEELAHAVGGAALGGRFDSFISPCPVVRYARARLARAP